MMTSRLVIIRILPVILLVAVLFLVASHWFFAQRRYIQLLPPTVFSFLKLLKSDQFQGGSVISNTYSVPFTRQTGGWGYNDWNIASTQLKLGSEGYFFPKSVYLWFADRKTNPVYLRPSYFVCFEPQTFHTALQGYKNPKIGGYLNHFIVRQALSLEKNELKHKLIDYDRSGNRWAIVQVGWDFPPYLEKLNMSKTEKILISLYKQENLENVLKVQYKYKQQDGVVENNSLVTLYRSNKTKYGCYLSSAQAIVQAYGNGDCAYLKVPRELSGKFAVVITPQSSTRAGEKWVSNMFEIDKGNIIVESGETDWRGMRDYRH